MDQIEIAEKILILDTIALGKMDIKDFEIVDKPEQESYSIIFRENHNYQFTLFFSRPGRTAGKIMFSARTGSPAKVEGEILRTNIEEHVKKWVSTLMLYRRYSAGIGQTKMSGKIISEISPRFQSIYSQSERAEGKGLYEICGMGFRKAFEFLLKDYLVYSNLLSPEKLSGYYSLANCIDLFKINPTIQTLARHISKLGNDYAHYNRNYEHYDIKDLKTMIALLVDWIETAEKKNKIEHETKGLNDKFNIS